MVAPFYAGLAYRAGAIAETHGLMKKIFGNSRMQPEIETTEVEENAEKPTVSEQAAPVTNPDKTVEYTGKAISVKET